MNKKNVVVSLVVFAVIIAVAAVLYFAQRTQPPTQNQPAATSVAPAAPQSLGGQIYEQAANPLSNKIPDTNPAKNANPIQGLDVNPF